MKKKNLFVLSFVLLITSCKIRVPVSNITETTSVSSETETLSENESSSEESLLSEEEISSEEEIISSEEKVSSESQYVELEEIKFSEESKTLILGESFTLTPEFLPSNASNTSGSWMTSSRKVATVDNGVVTSVGVGTCRITYTVGSLKAVCSVNVKSDDTTIHVTGISLNKESVTLNKGDELTLSYTLSPSDTTEKNVKWSTSDASIASVENGKVTALSKGTALISVVALDGNYSSTCVVTVEENEAYKEGYHLLWNDEFNGTSLDTSIWGYDVGGDGWGNSELEYYTAGNNVSVSDGTCKIIAKRETYSGKSFTSSRIVTRDKQEFTYGYVEARLKVPAYQGTWPAFWMLGKDIYSGQPWPYCGEIDIMEYANASPTLFGTLHWNANGKNTSSTYSHAQYGKTTSVNNMTEYHTYALDWTSTYIRILIDDVSFFEMDTTASTADCFHDDFYVLFNLAVGGNFVSEWNVNNIGFTESAVMEIDYVRVFQKNS